MIARVRAILPFGGWVGPLSGGDAVAELESRGSVPRFEAARPQVRILSQFRVRIQLGLRAVSSRP